MESFTKHTGIVAPLDRADVDTDQIIPKQFLKRVERTGYGEYLFWDWRMNSDGTERLNFVLNKAEYAGASILVARENFGCGSSREHAAWALRDFGIRAVLAPSFADIFRENADQNGIAAVELSQEEIATILHSAQSEPPLQLTVDLKKQTVWSDDGIVASFQFDSFRRTCLLEGLDRIGLTLRNLNEIEAYERIRWPER